MENYRIKDIAEMAKVSVGTVDRVLHNRGRVSEESLRKVKKVLKKIDYHPNLIARSLASKKDCRIMVLMPSFASDEYWSAVSDGVDKAEEEFFGFHLKVERKYFNQYDKLSFDALVEELKQDEYQGVVIATLFRDSTFELTQRLDKEKIPYVLIDAYIEDTNCVAYYGTDSYQSGYIGGRLLFENIMRDEKVLLFRVISRGGVESTQISMRENGFRDYLNEVGFCGSIYSVSVSAEFPEKNKSVLDAILERESDITAGIIFNSRVHVVASYFQEKQLKNFSLIGYDAIKSNIAFLKSGIVSHLVAQRPEVQGYNSVKALFHYIVLNQAVRKMNYMPMDILIKENIEFYNNYI